jgi:hypothetical protein
MLDYLNDNGAAFTFIASLILVLVTTVYVWFHRAAGSRAERGQ